MGFSSASVQADVGLVGMHSACAETYDENTRMCLDIEVFKTPNLQAVPSTNGWLQPTSYFWPTSSILGSSCSGWSVNTGSGATWVTGDSMQIDGGSNQCTGSYPVACCK